MALKFHLCKSWHDAASHKTRSSNTLIEMWKFSHKTQTGQKFILNPGHGLISGKKGPFFFSFVILFVWLIATWGYSSKGLETGICILKPWHLPCLLNTSLFKRTKRMVSYSCWSANLAKSYTEYTSLLSVQWNLTCNYFWATIFFLYLNSHLTTPGGEKKTGQPPNSASQHVVDSTYPGLGCDIEVTMRTRLFSRLSCASQKEWLWDQPPRTAVKWIVP